MQTWIEELLLENKMNERAFDNSHFNGDTAFRVRIRRFGALLGRLCANPTTVIGLIIIGLMMAMAIFCLLYTSPSPRDRTRSRMPSSA